MRTLWSNKNYVHKEKYVICFVILCENFVKLCGLKISWSQRTLSTHNGTQRKICNLLRETLWAKRSPGHKEICVICLVG
jgi:hypothetical protein